MELAIVGSARLTLAIIVNRTDSGLEGLSFPRFDDVNSPADLERSAGYTSSTIFMARQFALHQLYFLSRFATGVLT